MSTSGFIPSKINRSIFALWLMLLLWVPFVAAQQPVAGERLVSLELQLTGKKYVGDPLEVRVERLEQILNKVSPPHASLEYRLAQLNAVEQETVTAEAQRAAIGDYNRAIDFAAQHRDNEAISAYREALRKDPGLIQAYNNLASLLEQREEYDKAIEVYRQALQKIPDSPLLHRNLGVVYIKIGKVREGMAEYSQYVRLEKDPDPGIVAMVESFHAEQRKSDHAEDYVAIANREAAGNQLLWEARTIPVHVQIGQPEQVHFIPLIYDGLKQWEIATRNRLQFREVASPLEARIIIILKEGPLSHPYLHVGRAEYYVPERRSPRDLEKTTVSITVNTGEAGTTLAIAHRKDQVKRLALHELGHAVGIWGHSPDPGDIMYTHPLVSELSTRDVNTIQKLYGIR